MEIWLKFISFITSWVLVLSPGNTFYEGVEGQPTSFLPSQAETTTDKTISSLIYRGLFKYDIYGALVPDLAEGWEISEDGLVYTVTLKENQLWDDSTKITSDDVIYTSFKVSTLAGVATDKVDDRTVRFTLPNKFSPFPSLLTIGIMKSNSEENQNPLKPISSGRFKIIRVSNNGPVIKDVMLYNKNEDEDIRKLVFRFYSNQEELELAAKLGEISGFVADGDLQLQNFKQHQFPLQGIYYALFFNVSDENVSDVEFRKKLRSSISMEDVVMSEGVLVQGPISKSIFTDESIPIDYYDEDLPEEVFTHDLEITIPDLKIHEKTAKKISDYWSDKFNVDVEIKKINPEKILNEVIAPRDFQILLYGQEVGRDPDRYVYWHSTQAESPNLNLSGFKQVRADRALEEGRNVTDFAERKIHYTEFQTVVEDNVPAIFLYHPNVKYYVSEFVDGIGEKFTFTLGDRFLDFSNWELIRTN